MPTKLLTTTARDLTQFGALRRQAKALAQQVAQGKQTLTIRGPYAGMVPDVDPNLTDGTAFVEMENCLARAHGEDHGEVLGLPDGFRQVDSTRLPLGDSSPPAATGEEVVALAAFQRAAPTGHADPGEYTGEFINTPMAATAGDGSTGDTGYLYRIASNNQWTLVGISAAASTTRALAAGRDGRSTSQSMPDYCVAPFGATARATNTAAGNDDLQSGAIQEPAFIFTNDVDEVMVFPSSTTESLAGTHTYEPLCDETSSATLDGGGADGFKCKSVETWNGRVYFLNTAEAGTRRPFRLRRTAKFTADPNPSTAGAGFYDFREFSGEGLRIETLGDVLAVYFSDGVAFMRPTGVPTSPDEPQIISTERGLLSTHSMCAIGRNVHFGIFTDGWWLLDQSGRWQEVGITEVNGRRIPKWRQTFYDAIPATKRHRIYCYYDQPNNLVYIARPTTEEEEPEEVWIWDPSSDRVFMENYPVTCFGTFTPLAQSGTTIDGLTGTIDGLTGAIDSYDAVTGFPKARVHGDQSGFVYAHSRLQEGFHPPNTTPAVQDPAWSFTLGWRSPGGIRNLTTVDRVSLEYFNHENDGNVTVHVSSPQADGAGETASGPLNEGEHEDVRYRDYWFRYTTNAPGLQVSGSGEYHIRALEVDMFVDAVEPRGQDTP